MPEQPLGQATSMPQPSAAAAPASAVSATTASGAGHDPGAAAPSTATPAEEYVGILDYAKSLGVDLAPLGDDQRAVAHLLQIYRNYPQVEQLARYGSEYLQNYDDYQKYLTSRQAPGSGVPAAPAGPLPAQPPYSPPARYEEIQNLLGRWYEKDPVTGEVRPRMGTPAGVVKQVSDYSEWAQGWESKLRHSPKEALQDLVREQAREIVQQEARERQKKQSAEDIITRHAAWIFHADPRTGAPIYGSYTPYGVAFWNAVQRAERMGVTDVYDQEHYALTMLQNEFLQYQGRQQQPVPPQGQPPPAPAPAPPPPQRAMRQPGIQPGPNGAAGLNLGQLIRRDLQAAGIQRFNLSEE